MPVVATTTATAAATFSVPPRAASSLLLGAATNRVILAPDPCFADATADVSVAQIIEDMYLEQVLGRGIRLFARYLERLGRRDDEPGVGMELLNKHGYARKD